MKRALLFLFFIIISITSYAQILSYDVLQSATSKKELPTKKPIEYQAADGNIYTIGNPISIQPGVSDSQNIIGNYDPNEDFIIMQFYITKAIKNGLQIGVSARSYNRSIFIINLDQALLSGEIIRNNNLTKKSIDTPKNNSIDTPSELPTEQDKDLRYDNIISMPIGDYPSYIAESGDKIVAGQTTVVIGTTFSKRFKYINCPLNLEGYEGIVDSIYNYGKYVKVDIIVDLKKYQIIMVDKALMDGEIYVKNI